MPLMSTLRLACLAACICTAFSTRQLQQYEGTTSFPGCTFLSDSEIATNPDFSTLYENLQATGLNDTLSNLKSVVTLFAPTNEAFVSYLIANNETGEEATTQARRGNSKTPRFLVDGLEYHVATKALRELSSFQNDEVLPTLFVNNNLTVAIDENNGTEAIYVVSYGSEALIITPPAFACNLIIYGIDNVLTAEESLPFDEQFYGVLARELLPGGAKVPAQLIVDAVAAGHIRQVAAVFVEAVHAHEEQSLIDILAEAVHIHNGVRTLASIANEMIRQSNCATVSPLIEALYPTIYSSSESLGLTAAERNNIPHMDPLLARCAIRHV